MKNFLPHTHSFFLPVSLTAAFILSGCTVQMRNNPEALAAANALLPVHGSLFIDGMVPYLVSPSLTPTLTGHASIPLLFVRYYSDSACTVQLGASTLIQFQAGFTLTVPQDVTTQIYGKGFAVNSSAATDCTFLASYTNDTLPPVLTFTTPANGSFINASTSSAVTFTGACETGAYVQISGATTGSTPCLAGTYYVTLDLSSLADGSLSFTASQTDLAGNVGSSPTNTITKSISAPSVAITSPAASSYANAAGVSAFTVSGICSENGRSVVLSGAASAAVTCTSGAWTKTFDLSALADGAFTIKADHTNLAGNPAVQATRAFIKDATAPTVAITSPAASSYINSSSAGSFTLSGTCSENTRTVSISGAATATATCTSSAWSATLDLSLVADGTVTLKADLTDAAGNAATQSSSAFTKVSNPGGTDTIAIAGGAAYTNTATVALTLSSANYTNQMYITNTAACASGGAWEAYATSKSGWTLGQTNATATVYVRFKDTAGNVSACINDTIIHDNAVPTIAITSPAASSYVNAGNQSAFTVSGTCSESGRTVTIGGSASSTTTCSGGNTFSLSIDLSPAASGAISVTADLNDAAGNNATQASRAFIKDVSTPTVAITSPASSSYITSSTMASFTVSGTCSEDTKNVVLSGAASATVTCSSGTWTKTFDLSALAEGSFTIKADHSNAAGNPATQATRSFTKDTTAPTLAITSPAASSYVNLANVSALTVSGTCSENGRTVTFSGAATGTATCTTGAFSASLNFSSAAAGAITLNADLSDAAGNVATQATLALVKDTTAPTLAISAPSSGTVANNSGTVTYTITVTGSNSVSIAASDITLGITGGATCTKAVTNGTTASVTVTLSSCTGVTGTVNISVAAGVASDTAGNTSAAVGPSSAVTVGTTAFSQTWDFAALSSSNYTYNTSKLDFTGGVCRLSGNDQVDDDNSASGFGGGSLSGAAWDGTNSVVRISSTNTGAELDASWTPQWSNVTWYAKLNGSGSVSTGVGNILATIGTNGSANNSNSTGMSYQPGKVFQGLNFDGTDDFVSVAAASAPNSNSNITVSFWLKASPSNANWAVIAAKQALGYGWSIEQFAGNGVAHVRIDTSGNANQGQLFGSRVIYDNVFHHIVLTADSAGGMKLYVDGNLDASGTYTIGSGFASTADLRLGNNGGGYLTGVLDEVAIWNTVLGAQEVNTLYSRQSVRFYGTLTSRVMDALQTGMSWTTLSWKTTLPYFKELPDYASGTIQNESSTDYASLVGSTGTGGDNNLMSGIQGLWHLDEAAFTSGTGSIKDSSGQNNNGTPQNGVSFGNSGLLKGAATFDGSTQYIDLGSFQLPWSSPTWVGSVSFWAKGSGAPIANDRTGGANSFGWITIASGANGFSFANADINYAPYQHNITSTANVDTSKWSHFVITSDGNSHYQLSVDGVITYVTYTFAGSATYNNVTFGKWHNANYGEIYFNGSIDEIAVWNRALDPKEILQLYRRGANRVKHQVRTCTAADCSDDAAGANWKGPDGTNQTYFSELNNNTVPLAMSGAVKATPPSMLFSAFTSPVGTSRYFQYRTILESDDSGTGCNYGSGATWCSPELKSVTVDPVHYDSSAPTVVGHTGVSFYSLASFTQTLGSSCSSGVGYNLGVGSSYSAATWYWWDATANSGTGGWSAADGTVAKSNDAATTNSHAATFGTQVSTGTVYFKAFLKSSGSTACELDQLDLGGQQ